MAEQLGRGLQNLVDRCNSGSRLQFVCASLGEWWNGIHDRLKICCQIRLEGSSPSPPTKATNPLWDFLLCREISNENLGSANEERRLNTEFTLVFDEHRREKAIAAVPLRPPVIILLK